MLNHCVLAQENVRNAVVLNYPTDGVSLEVPGNREQQKLYLADLSDQLPFTKTIHNIKNAAIKRLEDLGKHLHLLINTVLIKFC